MYMKDYVDRLDAVLISGNRDVLTDSGKISHKQALEKAEKEYRKYQRDNLSPVEKSYLESIKQTEKTAKREVKKLK